jgi:hypothetical protein
MELIKRAQKRANEILASLNAPKVKMFLSEDEKKQLIDTAALLIALAAELETMEG